jgi:FkbM family methyltransferase
MGEIMSIDNAVFNNKMLLKKVRGFIQLGASIGEEYFEWKKAAIKNQIYVEPIPQCYNVLRQLIAANTQTDELVYSYNCAIGDKTEKNVPFFLSKNSFCSSSLLQMSAVFNKYNEGERQGDTIYVDEFTLDDLILQHDIDITKFNMLYMDVQGCEDLVIQGATQTLKFMDFVFTEVNFDLIYKDITLFNAFDKYIADHNFKIVDLRPLYGSNGAQGEALYFKKNISMKEFN